MTIPEVERLDAAPASFVDLHAHSTASDGSATPEEFVESARAAGLAAVALTDHDTLAGVPAARAAGERVGLRIVAGVELSAVDNGREVHVLGLHIAQPEVMDERLSVFQETRRTRAAQIVSRLNGLGVPVTLDAVLTEAGEGAVGRPHVARAVVAGGWARDVREVFDRWLGAGRPANVEKHRLTMGEGTELIHASGGIAVLAHPGGDLARETVRRMVGQGLDGLEVRHPSQSPDDERRLMGHAQAFSLVVSGGSDWHGASDGLRTLGAMRVPSEWLERQEERVAAVRARAG